MKYADARDDIKSFDIFLFSGKGRISEWIKWATGSDWSHVGLSLCLHQYDCVVLFESTTLSNLPDLISGTATKGVQLVNLSLRLNDYDGDIGWRPVSGPRRRKMKSAAMDFVREFHGTPYERSQIELIKSAFDFGGRLTENQEDASSIFCSELAAMLFRHVGIMPEGMAANEFTPADFSTILPLNPDYEAQEIIPLVI